MARWRADALRSPPVLRVRGRVRRLAAALLHRDITRFPDRLASPPKPAGFTEAVQMDVSVSVRIRPAFAPAATPLLAPRSSLFAPLSSLLAPHSLPRHQVHLHPHRAQPHLWVGMILEAKQDMLGAAAAHNRSRGVAKPYDWQPTYRCVRLDGGGVGGMDRSWEPRAARGRCGRSNAHR